MYPYDSNIFANNRLQQLQQQKQMLDMQINQLTNQMQTPNVNVNVNPQSSPMPGGQSSGASYDAGIIYVDGKDDAKKAASDNIPILFMEKENPVLHMKQPDGTLKSFRLEPLPDEVEESSKAMQNQIDSLNEKMSMILNALQNPASKAEEPEAVAESKPTQRKGTATK